MTNNTGATHLDDVTTDYDLGKSPVSSKTINNVKARISDAVESGTASASELADSVMQTASDAGEYLKANGKKLAQSAKENASVAAETVKANPGKTAAVIGGLVAAAAAAVVGTKMYQANSDKKPAAPRRSGNAKTASRKSSSSDT